MRNTCMSTREVGGILLEYKLLVGRNIFHGLGDPLRVLIYAYIFCSWILIYGEELDQVFVAMYCSDTLRGYKT